MQMFEGAPPLAHRLMIRLVDSALQSLVAEKDGWVFDDSKQTCVRIRISAANVPMDAIPEDKFVEIKECKQG